MNSAGSLQLSATAPVLSTPARTARGGGRGHGLQKTLGLLVIGAHGDGPAQGAARRQDVGVAMTAEVLHGLREGVLLGGERPQGALGLLPAEVGPSTFQTGPDRPGGDQLVGRDVGPDRVQVLDGGPRRASGDVQDDPGGVLGGDAGLDQGRQDLGPGGADGELAGVVDDAHQERVLQLLFGVHAIEHDAHGFTHRRGLGGGRLGRVVARLDRPGQIDAGARAALGPEPLDDREGVGHLVVGTRQVRRRPGAKDGVYEGVERGARQLFADTVLKIADPGLLQGCHDAHRGGLHGLDERRGIDSGPGGERFDDRALNGPDGGGPAVRRNGLRQLAQPLRADLLRPPHLVAPEVLTRHRAALDQEVVDGLEAGAEREHPLVLVPDRGHLPEHPPLQLGVGHRGPDAVEKGQVEVRGQREARIGVHRPQGGVDARLQGLVLPDRRENGLAVLLVEFHRLSSRSPGPCGGLRC